MKKGKIVTVVIVAVALIGAGILIARTALKKESSLKPEVKQVEGISKPIGQASSVKPIGQASSVKMESKEIDIDGMKMNISGEITKEDLEVIKSKLPKNLQDNTHVSVTVIKQDENSEDLTPEQRKAMARAIKEQLEKTFDKMPAKEREKMRVHLNTPEGEKAIRSSVMEYNKQLTGEERKAADPAFQAVLSTLNNIKEEEK